MSSQESKQTFHELGYKSYVVVGRVYATTSLAVLYYIIRKDFKNRRILNEQVKSLAPSLLHLSTFTFITCILYGVFAIGVWSPWGCIPMFKIAWILNGLQNDILGLFQIRRMQLCLSQDRVHSKFGYPRWVFTILYTIGIIHAVYIVCVFTILTDGIQLIEVNVYGTFWTGCVSRFEQIAAVQYSVMIAAYMMWDWATLFLYFYKISQFRKKSNEKSEIVFVRVNAILNRVVLLTMLAEFMYISLLCTTFALAMGLPESIGWPLQSLFACPDIFNIALVVALMSEHNRDQYIKFLVIIKRFHIFFCCPRLVKDAAEYYENEDTAVKQNQSHNKTLGISSFASPQTCGTVKMEHSTFLDNSNEITQTNTIEIT